MRRFLVICVTLVVLFFLADAIIYRTDLVLPILAGSQEVDVLATRFDKKLFIRGETGEWQEFIPRGINLPISMPGIARRDDLISINEWLVWLDQIGDLNVNCVRLYTIASQAFYDALYTFNTTREKPLYLFQGVWVDDNVVRSSKTAYDVLFRDQFISDARMAVDVVHGRRKIFENNRYGNGTYTKDLSPWTLGYLLGVPWEADMVAYTDHIRDDVGGYQGDYLYTDAKGTPFEALLTEVGDKLIAYETQKYQTQKLVSFINDVFIDPLEHDNVYSSDRFGVASVDMEHILSTDAYRSGLFVSYHVYPWTAAFLGGQESSYYFGWGDVSAYQGYLAALNAYYSLPLVVAEYGYPSARGLAGYVGGANRHQGNLSEVEQGQGNVELYNDIMAADCAGSILSSWQDEWHRGAWNTMFSVERTQSPLWYDMETADQHFGLLAFDPGAEKSVCYVDGNISEWEEIEPLRETGELTLKAQYDEAYVYFCIQTKEAITATNPIYIALDTTPNSGAHEVEETLLTFDRGVDFLATIRGRSGSKLEVHAYYEQLRANWWRETYQQDGYEFPPETDTATFRPIYLLANPVSKYLDTRLGYEDALIFEAGLLRHGNGNPEAETFDSIADYFINGTVMELRLPWQLINFANPAEMMIHDDYFDHFGVKHIQIDEMYIDVKHNENTLGFAALPLTGWGEAPAYHQRLKASYYIVQEAFAQAAAAEER